MFRLILILVALAALTVGCQPNTEPLERFADRGFQVVEKVAIKAMDETSTRTAYLAGGAEAIEPGYRADVGGGMFNGFIGWLELKARGVSARLSGHAQADEGQATTNPNLPGDRYPQTQPE